MIYAKRELWNREGGGAAVNGAQSQTKKSIDIAEYKKKCEEAHRERRENVCVIGKGKATVALPQWMWLGAEAAKKKS